MSERLLQLDDVRNTDSPQKVANLVVPFCKGQRKKPGFENLTWQGI